MAVTDKITKIFMRTLQQSPSLRAVFKQKIDTKKSTKHQEIHETLGDGFLGGSDFSRHLENLSLNLSPLTFHGIWKTSL